VRAFAIDAFGSLFKCLGAIFRQMGTGTFNASWGESAVDTGMTKSLAFKALGGVCHLVGFYLYCYIKYGRFIEYRLTGWIVW